jgi:hypothetical protein
MSDGETKPSYGPPVAQLLTLGDPRGQSAWPDYLALGFTQEHVPELIRLVLDPALNFADTESLEVWAPLHAWRTLGQLKAVAAIEPLTELFHLFEDDDGDDWVTDELPQVYALIGPAAIPTLTTYLADTSHSLYPRTKAATCLEAIGNAHPEARADCVAVLTRQLERFAENDYALNAFIISSLVDLNAVEALPVIEQAYLADRVDQFIMGDFEDVQIGLGLKEADPNRPSLFERLGLPVPSFPPTYAEYIEQREIAAILNAETNKNWRQKENAAKKKEKSKRKATKKMQKQNRKRK